MERWDVNEGAVRTLREAKRRDKESGRRVRD